MIYTSLAVVVLSASSIMSSAIPPLSNLFHYHPRTTQSDTRVSLTLVNKAAIFRDVKIDGHTYTVTQHGTLNIKAPSGTIIYAASRTPTAKRGDVLLQLTPQMNNQNIILN